MSGKRRATREGRVLLVAPDSTELARLAAGLRAEGWRVTALSRFEAAPPIFSSAPADLAIPLASETVQVPMTVVQRLNALARGTLPMWVCCGDPASYAGLDDARASAIVGVLPTPPNPRQLSARMAGQLKFRAAIQRATRGSADYMAGRLKDPLTGVCSRGYFMEAIAQEIRRGERFGSGAFQNWAVAGNR